VQNNHCDKCRDGSSVVDPLETIGQEYSSKDAEGLLNKVPAIPQGSPSGRLHNS
jgi:hypothetical protein